jgi:hypothetical protein
VSSAHRRIGCHFWSSAALASGPQPPRGRGSGSCRPLLAPELPPEDERARHGAIAVSRIITLPRWRSSRARLPSAVFETGRETLARVRRRSSRAQTGSGPAGGSARHVSAFVGGGRATAAEG